MQTDKLTVKIAPKAGFSYDIIIGSGILNELGTLLKKHTNAKKFLVVTNETILKFYPNALNLGENAHFVVLKDGEEYKNFDSLKKILDAAIEHKIERRDCLIAFGGGVVGDITGFAASVYLRGVDFVQIPTTLLAQVDSSVGGKVAINHEKGKNLIGAFYQPKFVLADISLLKTLDERQLKTGLGEVLKYAFIEKSCACPLNYRFFDFLHANYKEIIELEPSTTAQLINICCTLKAAVVAQDEREKGLRAILNFGHTFAHAIETLSNYTRFTHGEAVAAGMKMAAKLGVELKMVDEDYKNAVFELIDKYGLDVDLPEFDSGEFIEAMTLDKKADDSKIRFILPDGDFRVKLVSDVAREKLLKVLR